MRATLLASLLCTTALLAACGDDGGDDDQTPTPDARIIDASDTVDTSPGTPDAEAPDAGPAPDASTALVTEVPCSGATIAQTFTTSGLSYSPQSATIPVGAIAKFAPSSGHDAVSNDGLFSVGLAGTGCFRFDTAGTYVFHCTPHGFQGTLTVQPPP